MEPTVGVAVAVIAIAARRVGCTEGQLYTMATGLVLALLLAFSGVGVPELPELATSSPSFGSADPASTETTPLVDDAIPTAASTTGEDAVVATPPASTPALTAALVAAAPALADAISEVAASTTASVAPPSSAATAEVPTSPATFATIDAPGAPGGLALAADGSVFVTTDNGTARGVAGPSKVFHFDTAGRPVGAVTVTGQPDGHADGLGAAAVDPDGGSVLVIDRATARVLRVDARAGRQSTALSVPDVAPCPVVLNQAPCEQGTILDHAPAPSALAVDARGGVLIADAGQGTIWRWQAGDDAPVAWYQAPDLATGDGPAGLAFAGDGTLLVTVGSALDPSNPGGGGLYRLAVQPDGSPGARTLITAFSSSDRPGPLAVAADGTAYLVVRGTGAIVSVADGEASPFETAGSPIPLDAPSALAVDDQRLLVANQSATNTASHWAVLRFPLGR